MGKKMQKRNSSEKQTAKATITAAKITAFCVVLAAIITATVTYINRKPSTEQKQISNSGSNINK